MQPDFREHYAQKFRLKLDRLPTKATDRVSRLLLLLAFISGLMFLALGSYLVGFTDLSGTTDFERHITQTSIKIHSFISTATFSYLLLFLGLGIVLVSLFHLFRSKKVSFDGQTFIVKDFPVFGTPHSFEEPLSKYKGVRLRLKFCQYGLLSKNKFIIELYHDDPKKIVPLYISINPKHIRSIWKEYASALNLPPIHLSEKGMVAHRVNDMDRSYAEVVKEWNLPKDFVFEKKHSKDFACKQRQDKKLIKARHIMFDLYSVLNIFSIILLSLLLGYAFYNHSIIIKHIPLHLALACYALILTLIVYAFLTLMVKDLMIIHNKRIIIFRKLLGFAIQDAVIHFSDIKSIEIPFTPTTGRYALQIITNEQNVIVFNKFSANDLRWIRGFLVCEIME